MRTRKPAALLRALAGVLAITVGSLNAQTVLRSGLSSDVTVSVSPGTHGTEVYRQPSSNGWTPCVTNTELLGDMHLTTPGNLVSFDFAYTTVSVFDPAATSVIGYFKFYENSPTDTGLPATLLGEVTVPNLPVGVFLSHFGTVDLDVPIALPQDIWMGIRFDIVGIDTSDALEQWCDRQINIVSPLFGAFGAGTPVLGTTHNVYGVGAPYQVVLQGEINPTVTLRMGLEVPTNHPPTCMAALADAQDAFPQTASGSFIVTEGETISVPFIGVDPDTEPLSVSAIGLPATASLSPTLGFSPLTSIFAWTPTASDKGNAPYDVEVTFTDPAGGTASCSVTIAEINLRPVCSANDQTVPCTSSLGASVTLDGSATDADVLDVLSFHWDVSESSVILDNDSIATPTGVFPIGVTMATLTVVDGRGGVSTCDVLISVEDAVAPEVMCTSDVAALWPANHKMRTVTLIVTATDDCADPGAVLPINVIVSSDEPDNAVGKGDGNTTGDVNGADGYGAGVDVTSLFTFNAIAQEWVGTIELRAERQGSGDGRKYTIDVTAIDASENSATTSCCVVVPHDRRKKTH